MGVMTHPGKMRWSKWLPVRLHPVDGWFSSSAPWMVGQPKYHCVAAAVLGPTIFCTQSPTAARCALVVHFCMPRSAK